ncbi:MAG: ketol-acid reductoisomerase [Bacteriovoracaceae bacterium]
MTNSIINAPLVIIGFGSQAKAWALNLRDSEIEVLIGLRAGSPSRETVSSLGFKSFQLGTSSFPTCSAILLLIPDHLHEEFLKLNSPFISEGTRIVYAHGYSVTKSSLQKVYSKLSHLLLAPKAIASEVRFQYETKGKLGALYSTEYSLDKKSDGEFLNALSKSIGITAGPYRASFEQEMRADLFSEQALLCGLIPYAALTSYNKLRAKGIPKEAAYMECWLETKLICDAMVKMGPVEFFKLISPNALIGGEKAQKQLLSPEYLKTLDGLIEDIWDKNFFKECDETDVSKLKNEVLEFWQNQELSQTHEELSKDLF